MWNKAGFSYSLQAGRGLRFILGKECKKELIIGFWRVLGDLGEGSREQGLWAGCSMEARVIL